MNNRFLGALVCGVLAAISLTASCVVAAPPPDSVYVRVGPPAPVVEVSGVAPGPDFVWIRGHHRWNGSTYVWAPGRWERRPRAGAVWVHGQWRHHRNGWYWVEGRWR